MGTVVLLVYFVALGFILGQAMAKRDREKEELTRRVYRLERGEKPAQPEPFELAPIPVRIVEGTAPNTAEQGERIVNVG